MTIEFYTTGVYGSTEDKYFQKLIDNQIDTFLDIRRRRGVRGSKYAFVNSKRLQDRLKELDIKYEHILDLSPTKEIRELQKEADKQAGIQKRERNELGQVFRIAFKNKILNEFNLSDLIKRLEKSGAKKVVLFCVEKVPEACHRSIVTDKINNEFNLPVTHLE